MFSSDLAPSVRQRKISELLRREVSSCLLNNFPVDNGRIISCSAVHVARDLKSADVFLSMSGDKVDDAKPVDYQKIKPSPDFIYLIKTWISSKTSLKSVPEFHFYQSIWYKRVCGYNLPRGNDTIIAQKMNSIFGGISTATSFASMRYSFGRR